MTNPARILIVEDLSPDLELAQREIQSSLDVCVFEQTETRMGFLDALKRFQPDLILADYDLPAFDGMASLKLAREQAPHTPVIIWTSSRSEDIAVECMKAGAANYIIKENLRRLGPAVLHALGERRVLIERKRAEEALRVTEEKYRRLVEQIPVAVYIDTGDEFGTKTYLGPQFEWITGYPAEDWIGNPDFWAAVIHPADREGVLAENARTNLTGEPFVAEYRLRKPDGQYVWVREDAVLTSGTGEGSPVWQGTLADIGGRKRAEIEGEALLDIMRGLAETEDLQEFVRLVHCSIARVVYAENFFVVFHNEETGLFEEIYTVDKYDTPAPPSRLDKSLSAYVFRTGKPLLVRRGEFAELAASGEVELIGVDSASWLGAPIKTRGKTIGVMAIQDYENSERYSEHDKDFLASIAGQTALAIERKLAEEELRQSQELYRLLVETSPDAIGMATPDGRLTFANRQAVEIFGYRDSSELLETSPVRLFAPEERRRLIEEFRTLEERVNIQNTYWMIRKDGSRFYGEVRTSLLSDQAGQPSVVVTQMRDITEWKSAEDALRESEERMRRLASATFEGVLFSEGGIIREGNEQLARIYGRELSDMIGRPILDFVAPEWRDHVREKVEAGSEGTYEYVGLRKDGSSVPVEVQARMLVHRGRPVRVSAIRDITERKQMENSLQEERNSLARRVEERTSQLSFVNAELTRANRMKDEFLSTMSHELRTPLNAILSLSESLEEGTYGPLTPEQASSLKIISESGYHLLGLINDILDVSKIEAGKLGLEIVPVDIDMASHSALRLVRQQAAQKRLRVSYSRDADVTGLAADDRRLKQMLVNLLSNAVKFTPEGGEIGLEVSNEAEGEIIRFTVWDTGPGIPAEKLDRLFQPFVQLDSSLSRSQLGTGLGLALVRRLAELHGGGAGVQTQSGHGSRFYFALPAGPQTVGGPATLASGDSLSSQGGEQPSTGPQLQDFQARGACALVAEDNPVSMTIIRDYLVARGFRVVAAGNGLEALDRAAEFEPDLILMDIQMPEMDGLEACRRLRAIPRFASVPILAMTALAMPGDRERCLGAGATNYMTKPLSLRALLATTQGLLDPIGAAGGNQNGV